MLFKKNTQQEIEIAPTQPQPSNGDQELKALEAQLEFLQKPAQPAAKQPVEPPPQRFPAPGVQQSVNAPLRLVPGDAASVAPVPLGTAVQQAAQASAGAAQSTGAATPAMPQPRPASAPQPPTRSGSPVAPAIEPPPSILDPAAISQAAHAEPAAKQADNAAAQQEAPKSQVHWGRQMNYRTAVVKSGGQSNSIMTSNRQEARPSQPLKNPLATPKKHVPKEMDFDIQPTNAMMHFDVVDMTGIDHFDIN